MRDELDTVFEPIRTDDAMHLFGLQPRRQLREPVNQLMWQTPNVAHQRA